MELTSKARRKLPGKDFAGPGRSYPINDASHARNALARAAQHASPELQSEIKAKVRKRFPAIQVEGEAPKARKDKSARKGG